MGWNFYSASGELQINDGGVQAASAVFTGNVDLGSNLLVGNAGSTGIAISSAGEVNMAAQPGFLVINSAEDADVTGNGAEITVDFDTEIFDQNADFASDTFTAPVSGRYLLAWGVEVNDISSDMTRHENRILTSNRSFMYNGNPANLKEPGSDRFTFTGSVVGDMDADDTVTVRINFLNGAGDTADITGDGSYMRTFFSGWLMG